MIALLLLLLAMPPYHRAEWPHWKDLDRNGCSAREDVLIAESLLPVTLGPKCRVLNGAWLDHYTGELLTSPGLLDVDHVIPLKAAHDAGGWRWDRTVKTQYANDTTHPEHLIAVSLEANREKGSKGPDRWRPRKADWCEYATAWTTIAQRWGLTLTRAEMMALGEMSRTCPTP
jgi:hypothetical protein